MSLSRREFFQVATAGTLTVAAGERHFSRGIPVEMSRSARELRILVLGGTGFIGPYMVRYARERGHRLTLFNRGRTNPDLFPNAELLIGDRNGDISALETGSWDAVIDNSGYTPDQVRSTARLLQGRVGQYVFISTRAVYTDFTQAVMDEQAPVGPADLPEDQWDGYGPLKVLSEREVQEAYPSAATILRPPIMVGPEDRSDRFTYWLTRIDGGGEVLAPGHPTDPVQYLDARDLAEFSIRLIEDRTVGVFNTEGPAAALSSAEFLYGIRAITNSPVAFTWVNWDFLSQHDLEGWNDIPGWRPPQGEWVNYGRMDNSRAIRAGLTFRPLATTATETLRWFRGLPTERQNTLAAGISPQTESDVLRAWHSGR